MELLGLSWITLTILSSLPILYWYLTRNFSFWKKRGLSGPKPWPLVGNTLTSFFTPIPLIELDWFKKYGRIYGIYDKQNPILTIAEPDLIKMILVKDFHLFPDRKTRRVVHDVLKKHLFSSSGDDWKRLRSIMSPTFTSGKMKKMYPTIRKCLDEFLETLEVSAKNRDSINIKDAHGNFTMDVIASCAFATKTNSHSDPNNPFITNAKKILSFSFWRLLTILLLPTPVLKMLGIQSATDENANQFFMELTRHALKQRKANPNSSKQFNDFVQLLADAEIDRDDFHDKNDVNEAHHLNEGEEELEIEKKTFAINVVNKQLSEEEIMAQGWLFFIAGYETTATTLSFCSYELALHPEIQEKLYDEIVSVMDANGEISYEELSRLPLLDAVLCETLRMYPPVPRLERKALSDYKLGNTGLNLNKGQDIEIPVYAIHHSEDFYPNADRFTPERFLPENRHNVIPYTYLPFGVGPRNCIGMRFALMEAKLGLAHIVKRFRFFRSEQTAVPLEFRTVARLTSAKKVIVGIEKRD